MPFSYPSDPDVDLSHLIAGLLEREPFGFLEVAARTISSGGWRTLDLADTLARGGTLEGGAIALALHWLLGSPHPQNVLHPGIPPWLLHLDQGRIDRAVRRSEGAQPYSTSYILDLSLMGGQRGALHARIDHRYNHALTNAFVIDEPLERLALVLSGADSGGTAPYRGAPLGPVREDLQRGVDRYDLEAVPDCAGNPWPSMRPLFSFVMERFSPRR